MARAIHSRPQPSPPQAQVLREREHHVALHGQDLVSVHGHERHLRARDSQGARVVSYRAARLQDEGNESVIPGRRLERPAVCIRWIRE